MVIFHSYVKLPEGTGAKRREWMGLGMDGTEVSLGFIGYTSIGDDAT